MITITLTEAEAARVYYAMANEAHEFSLKMRHEIKFGQLSVGSGRAQIISENNMNEALDIMRKVEKAVEA